MAEYNYASKEINVKIVYYGPGLCGKTTNLQYIFNSVDRENRGEMIALATKTDRTLYFDFLPIHAGTIHGFKTRFLLYTVPGQVYYDSTRKVVLRGADGVVFVADSSPDRMEANKESLRNLETNLREHKLELESMPWVLQLNKRDLANALSIDEMIEELNTLKVPTFTCCAVKGDGVFESLHKLLGMTMGYLNQKAMKAGRTLFAKGNKGEDEMNAEFDQINWFSDLSNPPKLDLTTQVYPRLEKKPNQPAQASFKSDDQRIELDLKLDNDTKTSSHNPDDWQLDINFEPETIPSLEVAEPDMPIPTEPVIEPMVETQVINQNEDIMENRQTTAPAASQVVNKNDVEQEYSDSNNSSFNVSANKILRVKKTIDLPLQIKGNIVPDHIQLNLVLNIKLIPEKKQ